MARFARLGSTHLARLGKRSDCYRVGFEFGRGLRVSVLLVSRVHHSPASSKASRNARKALAVSVDCCPKLMHCH